MIENILKSFEIWSDAQSVKSKGRVKSIDNISHEGISRLRELILDLAFRGKLISQNINDEPASELLKKINKELTEKFKKEYSEKLSRDKSTIDPTEFHNKIPQNWIWCELQDLAILFNGKAHEQFIDNNGKYQLINSSFVSSEGRVFKTVSSQLTPLIKGDIAIVMSDVPEGKALVKCFLVEEDDKYSLNQRIGGISASSFLNRNFLMLALNRNKYYLQYDDGKKQTNLKKIQILSCPIPLPPFEEQQRIVTKVNELMKLCDKLEEEKANNLKTHHYLVRCLLETLENSLDADTLQVSWKRISQQFDTLFCTDDSIDQLKETILQLAISGKLLKQNVNDEPATILLSNIKKKKEELIQSGKIKNEKLLPVISDDEKPFNLPNGWSWCRLEELCFIITKGSSPKWQGVSYTENPEDVLFVTSENVGSYELLLETEKFVELKFNEIESKSILQNGDFLMNIVGGSIGRTAVFNLERVANINQAVCLIRTLKGFMNSQFLLHFFNSSICISYMFDKQVDNARANLSMGNIAKFVIPIPPQAEQQRIVEKISELYSICDLLKKRIESSQTLKLNLSETLIEF